MEQFNLNWHTYNDHLREMMKHLMESNESTDVTLVCEDKTKFKAHQFVLNACSPIFKSIINDLPQKDPIIYLRGVLAPEMKSILQFMYLGQATFYQDRMNEFLDVARSLEIKEISKDVDVDAPDSLNDQESDKNIDTSMGNSHGEKTITNPSNVVEEIKHRSSRAISQRNEAGQFLCNRCDKHFSSSGNLHQHINSAHEGIKFPCNDCGYEATRNSTLLIHIKSVHEGIKFPCDLCDYKASRKSNLTTHKKIKH